MWVKVIYLGGDPRKHSRCEWGSKTGKGRSLAQGGLMSRLSLCEQGLTPPGNSGTYLRIALRRGDGAGVDPPIPLCHWLRADPRRMGLIPLHFQVDSWGHTKSPTKSGRCLQVEMTWSSVCCVGTRWVCSFPITAVTSDYKFISHRFCRSQVWLMVSLLWVSRCQNQNVSQLGSSWEILGRIYFHGHSDGWQNPVLGGGCRTEVSVSLPAVSQESSSASRGHLHPRAHDPFTFQTQRWLSPSLQIPPTSSSASLLFWPPLCCLSLPYSAVSASAEQIIRDNFPSLGSVCS